MEKVGKYELLREIGRGATSTVYLASDPFSRREVAVKVAAPGILKDPARGQLYTHLFLNEAALIGKLSHPHIVQTHDAVVDDHFCYIVMEYVAGGTLETACSADRLLPLERVLEIIFKCTRALDFAVRAGITHRDIKPANILFTDADHHHGDIKISDWLFMCFGLLTIVAQGGEHPLDFWSSAFLAKPFAAGIPAPSGPVNS